MTRRRPAIPRLVAGLLLLVSLAVATGPAQARDAGLQVSRSAAGPFADQLPGPLLDGIGLVVPLDVAERHLLRQELLAPGRPDDGGGRQPR